MKFLKLFIVSLLLTIPAVVAAAQEGSLTFSTITWNFGDIEEASGPVSHTFIYRNTSSREQRLDMVIPSCDCTTASYSREPVLPGATGEVTVTYDPTSLPGQFRQNVRIFTEGGKVMYRLYLEGNVRPREKSVDEQCPYYLDEGLQTSSLSLRFGFVRKCTSQTKSFTIVNTSAEVLKVQYDFKDVKVKGPVSLLPGESARVDVTFTPENIGTLDSEIYVFSGDKGKAIKVLGYGVEYEDDMEESPMFRFEPTRAIFKRNKSSVEFYNNGDSRLTVSAIELPEGISADCPVPMYIEAGGKEKIRFKAAGFKGEAVIRVYSDDPRRPMREIICKN